MNAASKLGFSLAVVFAVAGCGDKAAAPAGSSALVSSGKAADSSSAAAVTPLKVGDPAPDVTLKLADGKEVKLASLKGKLVLVYFYPKDDTKGCTIEAQGIRDGWSKFQDAQIDVYGVSMQGKDSHKAFIDKNSLPFPLATDEDGKVADAFHVPHKGEFASRQSFLIGKDGNIAKVWLDVDPSQNADAVLAAAH